MMMSTIWVEVITSVCDDDDDDGCGGNDNISL